MIHLEDHAPIAIAQLRQPPKLLLLEFSVSQNAALGCEKVGHVALLVLTERLQQIIIDPTRSEEDDGRGQEVGEAKLT